MSFSSRSKSMVGGGSPDAPLAPPAVGLGYGRRDSPFARGGPPVGGRARSGSILIASGVASGVGGVRGRSGSGLTSSPFARQSSVFPELKSPHTGTTLPDFTEMVGMSADDDMIKPRDIFFVPEPKEGRQASQAIGGRGVKDRQADTMFLEVKDQRPTRNRRDRHNFTDIVDVDVEEAYENFISEDLLGRLLASWQFRMLILFVIVLNSILIGIQTDKNLEQRFSGILGLSDSIILTIFVVEICLKWYHGFQEFWASGWNVFDFAIVLSSLLAPSFTFLASGRALRILRVLRAFRTLRSISSLQGLQAIVQTMLRSLPDMGNIIGLLLILMFIFAVVGVNIFSEALPEDFGTIDRNMFTLFIMMTQDGWAKIFQKVEAAGLMGAGAAYFIIFITLGAFVFVNVIVGVMVTNLQVAYSAIKREQRQRHRKLKRQRGELDSKSISRLIVRVHNDPNLWKKQDPLERPEFNKMSIASLERYFLVLSAIEDNLAEHRRLKDILQKVGDEVKLLNVTIQRRDEMSSSESSGEADELSRDEDRDTKPVGDVLSEVIRRGQHAVQQDMRVQALEQQRRVRQRRQLFGDLREEQARVRRAQLWAAGGLQKRAQAQRQPSVTFSTPTVEKQQPPPAAPPAAQQPAEAPTLASVINALEAKRAGKQAIQEAQGPDREMMKTAASVLIAGMGAVVGVGASEQAGEIAVTRLPTAEEKKREREAVKKDLLGIPSPRSPGMRRSMSIDEKEDAQVDGPAPRRKLEKGSYVSRSFSSLTKLSEEQVVRAAVSASQKKASQEEKEDRAHMLKKRSTFLNLPTLRRERGLEEIGIPVINEPSAGGRGESKPGAPKLKKPRANVSGFAGLASAYSHMPMVSWSNKQKKKPAKRKDSLATSAVAPLGARAGLGLAAESLTFGLQFDMSPKKERRGDGSGQQTAALQIGITDQTAITIPTVVVKAPSKQTPPPGRRDSTSVGRLQRERRDSQDTTSTDTPRSTRTAAAGRPDSAGVKATGPRAGATTTTRPSSGPRERPPPRTRAESGAGTSQAASRSGADVGPGRDPARAGGPGGAVGRSSDGGSARTPKKPVAHGPSSLPPSPAAPRHGPGPKETLSPAASRRQPPAVTRADSSATSHPRTSTSTERLGLLPSSSADSGSGNAGRRGGESPSRPRPPRQDSSPRLGVRGDEGGRPHAVRLGAPGGVGEAGSSAAGRAMGGTSPSGRRRLGSDEAKTPMPTGTSTPPPKPRKAKVSPPLGFRGHN